jgi:hypothetical protein
MRVGYNASLLDYSSGTDGPPLLFPRATRRCSKGRASKVDLAPLERPLPFGRLAGITIVPSFRPKFALVFAAIHIDDDVILE